MVILPSGVSLSLDTQIPAASIMRFLVYTAWLPIWKPFLLMQTGLASTIRALIEPPFVKIAPVDWRSMAFTVTPLLIDRALFFSIFAAAASTPRVAPSEVRFAATLVASIPMLNAWAGSLMLTFAPFRLVEASRFRGCLSASWKLPLKVRFRTLLAGVLKNAGRVRTPPSSL